MKEINIITGLLCNQEVDLLNTNWEKFDKLVCKSNIQNLIYDKIKEIDDVPLKIKNKYKEDFEKNRTFNIIQCKNLRNILKKFNKEGIESIVFKGAYLIEKVYKKFGLRKMGDIDILLNKIDREHAIQILQESGFQYKKEHCSKEWFDKNYYRTALYVKGSVEIELHWSLFPNANPFKFKIGDIWETSKKENIFGVSVKEMKIELLLIYLCVHVSYCHFFNHNSIRRLYDIYLLILNVNIDWNYLINKSKEYDVNKFVGITLNFINEMFLEVVDKNIINDLIDKKTLENFKSKIDVESLFLNKRENNKRKIMERQRIIQLIGMNNKLNYIKIISTNKGASAKWIAALYDVSPESIRVLLYNWMYFLKILPKYLLMKGA